MLKRIRSTPCLHVFWLGLFLLLPAGAIPAQTDQDLPQLKPDPTRTIRGEVQFDRPLPTDATLEVIISGTGKLDADQALEAKQFGFAFHEFARAKVAADGSFEIPRDMDSYRLWLRVEGDYCHGYGTAFDVGGEDDPGEAPFQLHCKVGACVTLALQFPNDASEEDKRAVVGRTIPIVGVREEWDEQYSIPVNADFEIVIPRVAYTRMYSVSGTEFHDDELALAPFAPKEMVEFLVQPGERMRIPVELDWSPRLLGQVVNTEGEPMEGAEVTVRSVRYPDSKDLNLHTFQRATGKDGRFAMHDLPVHDLVLEARVAGQEPLRWGPQKLREVRATGEEVPLVVQPKPTLFGRVVWPEGVAARPVEVFHAHGQFRRIESSVQVGIDGRFAFPASFGTRYTLSVAVRMEEELNSPREDPLVARANCLANDTSLETPILLSLRRGGFIRGKVSYEEPEPMKNCSIGFQENREYKSWENPDYWTPVTINPATSEFYLERLNPGKYTIRATLDLGKDIPLTHQVQIDLVHGPIELVLELPLRSPQSGRVLTTAGLAVPNATVSISTSDRYGVLEHRLELSTDGAGHLTTTPLPPGEYHLSVKAKGMAPVRDMMVQTDPARPWTVEMAPGSFIEVTVFDQEGEPAKSQYLKVTDEQGHDLGGFNRTPSDPPGKFQVGPLGPGLVHLIARTKNALGSDRSVQSVAVPIAGNVATTFDLSKTPKAILTGTVSSDGKPMPGYPVWLGKEGALVSSTKTSAEGHFELALHELGHFDLAVHNRVAAQVSRQPIDIQAAPAPVHIHLPTGGVQGWIGGPVRQGWLPDVSAIREGEDLLTPYPAAEASAWEGDQFFMPHLADGRYSLVLRSRRKPDRILLHSKPMLIEVSGGRITEGIVIQPDR